MQSTRHTPKASAGDRGFTLVEVLLVIVIMSMMFVSISKLMQAARRTRDTIHNFQEMQLAGPAVLELMIRDLRGVFTTSRPRNTWLQITDRTVNGQDADRIDFVTTTDSLVVNLSDGSENVRADVNEVGYMMRPNRDNDEFLEVYRREDFGVDDEPFDGGAYGLLHDRVKGFQIQVYEEDGVEAEPVDSWGDVGDQYTGVPMRIEIELTVELAPKLTNEQLIIDRRTITYKRIVRPPSTLRMTQDTAVVPIIPVLVPPVAPQSEGVNGGLTNG